MAQPTNTFSTYDAVGNREDLSDVIALISPEETPFTSNIGQTNATAKYHEWQTDALAAAVDTNAVIEGDDATLDASTPTVRPGNYTQISDKTAVVTGTQEAVDSAGRASEMDYQVAKKGRELKTDVEKQMLSNKASVAGDDTTARQSAGLESWITTADDRGAGGAQGGFSAGIVGAPTDGTQRAFTETILKNVMKLRADAGNPNKRIAMYVGSSNKVVASGFTGVATARREAGDEAVKVIGSVEMYLSDFGWIDFIYSQFIRGRTALFVDHDYVTKAVLRDYFSHDLAKTGDTMKKQIIHEYTLEVKNEKAHGVAADLTTP